MTMTQDEIDALIGSGDIDDNLVQNTTENID